MFYNHSGEIIHAFNHVERGTQTRTDAETSSSIAIHMVLTYLATEKSPKKEVQIEHIWNTAIPVHSVYRGPYSVILTHSINYAFPSVMSFTTISEI